MGAVAEQQDVASARRRFIEAREAAIARREETGQPIIGYIGAGVPVEILLAAGTLPFRVGVSLPDTNIAAARYFERGDSEMIARFVSILLDGSHGFLDHLVIGNTPIMNVALLHFLREARRTDLAFAGPRVTLHEQFHGQDNATRAYNIASCQRLADVAGKIGTPINAASLDQAILQTNAMRSSLAALNEARRMVPAMLSGTAFLDSLAVWQMDALAQIAVAEPRLQSGPRILVSATDTSHLAHYPAIEAAGCTIVADDHDWGETLIEGLIETGGDPIVAIADRYARQSPRSARWPAVDRIAAVVARAAASRADAVLLCISDEDHASAWDAPQLATALAAQQIGCFDLGPQPATGFDEAQAVAKLKQWLPQITPRLRQECAR